MTKQTLTFCLSSQALMTSPAIMMGNVFNVTRALVTYSGRPCGRDSHLRGVNGVTRLYEVYMVTVLSLHLSTRELEMTKG